jgi:hypothetical protein
MKKKPLKVRRRVRGGTKIKTTVRAGMKLA